MLVLASFMTAMTGFSAPAPDEDNGAASNRCPAQDAGADVVDLADASMDVCRVEISTFAEYRDLIASLERGPTGATAGVPDCDRVLYFDASPARAPFDLAVQAFFDRLSGCEGFRFVMVTDRAGSVLKRIEIAAGAKAIPAVLWQNHTLVAAPEHAFEWRQAA
jgi:hypothetical protein